MILDHYISHSLYTIGSDRNFGSVRGSADFGRFGSADFGRFGSVRFGKNFAKLLPNFLLFNFMLTYYIRTDMQFSATNRFLSHSKIPQYISRQLRFTL